MNLGERITILRKTKKITQNILADKLYVSSKTISSWESNRTEPSLEMLIKLSEILECNVSYLVYGDVEKNDIETELKIKLDKKEYNKLIKYMENNSKQLNQSRQIDTYYQPTYRKFLDSDVISEWLRIGKRGNKTILNYKHWYNNMFCDEYEVEIDNDENLDKIFNVLGLEKIAIVDKLRKSYLYLNKYEIELDYIESLGYYIEIEVKKYDKNPFEEYDNMLKVAKDLDLNLNNIDKNGYPYHLIFNK